MFKIYLCGDKIYSCSTCRTHLAKHDQIVSKVRGRSHRLLGVLVLDGRGASSPLTCISILHSPIWRVQYTPLFRGCKTLPYCISYFLTHSPFYTPHVNGPIHWVRAAPRPQTKIVLQCVVECVCMPVQHTHTHSCTNAHTHMCTHNESRAPMYTLSLSLSPSFSLLLSLPVSHTHTSTQAFQGRHGRAFLFSNV